MKQADRKPDIHAIAVRLQKSQSTEVRDFLRLIELKYEDIKDQLVTSDGPVTIRLQGEAKALREISRTILTPVVTQPKELNNGT